MKFKEKKNYKMQNSNYIAYALLFNTELSKKLVPLIVPTIE